MGSLITDTPLSEVTSTFEAFDRLGITREDLKRLRSSSSRVADIARLFKSLVIDSDSNPRIYGCEEVEEHIKGGRFDFDPSRISLYQVREQEDPASITGHDLRRKLRGVRVMNECVLHALHANHDLIPEDWKHGEDESPRYVTFWGTVYKDPQGKLYVLSLLWSDGTWCIIKSDLDKRWSRNFVAAVHMR